MAKIQRQVILEDELYKKLRVYLVMNGMSFAGLVRKLIVDFLHDKGIEA